MTYYEDKILNKLPFYRSNNSQYIYYGGFYLVYLYNDSANSINAA